MQNKNHKKIFWIVLINFVSILVLFMPLFIIESSAGNELRSQSEPDNNTNFSKTNAFNLDLNSICYIIQNDRIDVGVAYSCSDPNIEFKWLSYDLEAKQWNSISDWYKGNWASWKPEKGNYWLMAQARISDGTTKSYTICFSSSKNYESQLDLNGICYISKNDRIDVGVAYSCPDPNIEFKWLSYNLDSKQWNTISDWYKGNWASWQPEQGNYWLMAQARKSNGITKNYTICFNVSRTYKLNDGYVSISSNVNSKFVINVPDASQQDKQKLEILEANEAAVQTWHVVVCSNGLYMFQNLATSLWLGSNDGYVSQIKVTDSAHPTADTQWKVTFCAGSYKLINAATNKAAELLNGKAENHNSIVLGESKASSSQSWDFRPISFVKDGTYNIVPRRNGNMRLQVTGGSFSNGAYIQTYGYNNSGAQSFRVWNNGDGTVSIRNAKSKRLFYVTFGSPVPGRYIQQYDYNGSSCQRWIPTLTSDGCIRFISAANTNLCLNCRNAEYGTITELSEYSMDDISTKFYLWNSNYPEVNWSVNCPYINQYPELPWGCESVALTELLHGMGYNIPKTLIADSYMPYSSWDFVHCYAGSPYNPPSGIGSTMPPCIADCCNRFLSDYGGSIFKAQVATGSSLGNLIERANCGYPSVVWTTMYMSTSINKWGQVIEGYQVWSGLHAVCLCGYDSATDQVLVCDSLSGKVYRPRSTFEYIFNATGQYAVTVE